MVEISTSILNVEKGKELETIYNLEKAKTDYIHIDVMDGKFVEKNTYEKMFNYATQIKGISNLPLDVHLMVEDVKKGIEDFSILEPNTITFHLEACNDKNEVIELINLVKQKNIKVGMSIKPKTPASKIFEYLKYIHTCLVMTVEPGKGGQVLLSEMVEKIKEIKKYVDDNNLDIDIEADGGINLKTYKSVKNAGANILVSGTAILIAKDFKTIIDELKVTS